MFLGLKIKFIFTKFTISEYLQLESHFNTEDTVTEGEL